KAVIQKETNGYTGYDTFHLGIDASNSIIRGGTFMGDRLTHDFSSGGTHESGHGITVAGAKNVTIEGAKSMNFTGDGLAIGAAPVLERDFLEKDFENGAIDDSGKLIPDTTKIRTKRSAITSFSDPLFQTNRTIEFNLPQNMAEDVPFDIYY